MNGFIICNELSKKYGKFFKTHIGLSSLNNRHLHEISLFFVLQTYIEIVLMRWSYSDETLPKFMERALENSNRW